MTNFYGQYIGFGAGGVVAAVPFYLSNTTSCFWPGANWRPAEPGPYYHTKNIDKNLFASDGDSTDQGDLTEVRASIAGASSTTHGYCMGGYYGGYLDNIERFAMASSADGASIGTLSSSQGTAGGSTSETHGWIHGGYPPGQRVEKVSFASDSENGVDVGDLFPDARDYSAGGSSATHGYSMGGIAAGTNSEQIHKWGYVSESASHHIGDLVHSGIGSANCSSDGYVWCMGAYVAPNTDRIDKMSTAADGNTVESGATLYTVTSQESAGAASATYGYIGGGFPKGDSGMGIYYRNTIEKWAFASTAKATDVGNLIHNRGGSSNSNQYSGA